MSDGYTNAVHRDLQELVHDMGMLLARDTGGTVAMNTLLSAQYLIDLFQASQDGDSVTDHLIDGAKAYKEIRMTMQDLGVDR